MLVVGEMPTFHDIGLRYIIGIRHLRPLQRYR